MHTEGESQLLLYFMAYPNLQVYDNAQSTYIPFML